MRHEEERCAGTTYERHEITGVETAPALARPEAPTARVVTAASVTVGVSSGHVQGGSDR